MKNYISIKPFIDFMTKAHEGQFDKVGQPYCLHPAAVSNIVEKILKDNITYWSLPEEIQDHLLNRATITAICHDLFEDTNTTKDDLINLGADDYIITALELLTHKKNESYATYINRINSNGIAMLVKLADLTHNMDIKRFAGIHKLNEVDIKRLNKYLDAYNILLNNFNNWLKNYEGYE